MQLHAGSKIRGPRYRPLVAKDDFEPAVEALVHAFNDDPFFENLWPDADHRSRGTRFIMSGFLLQALPDAHVFVTENAADGAIASFPPEAFPVSLRRTLGALPTALLASMPSVSRLPLRKLAATMRAMSQAQATVPSHYYVLALGIHPKKQGRGLGKQLLESVLDRADGLGRPTYLETTKEANLGFYGQFGFRVRDTLTCYPGAAPMWTMIRPAPLRKPARRT